MKNDVKLQLEYEQAVKSRIVEWRKKISNSILLAFTVFGAVAYLPSIYLSYAQGLINIIVLDTVVYILILILAFSKRIPISLKAVCSTALFYILGLLLLIILGPVGAGNLWLLAFSLVAGLTLGKRASVITLAINSATQLILLLLMHLNLLDNYEVAYSMEIWLARTTNFILLNIVITITNITYVKSNEAILTRSDETRRATIIGLAKLAEYRDSETGEHLQRIRNITFLLTRALKSTEKYKDYIREDYILDVSMSSILHDIGKVGILDEILLKPDRLTDEEFREIQKHPEYGAAVIREIEKNIQGRSLYTLGEEVAASHHEKWDGTGYPRGLAGEQIPLSARIVAIADVYDALTSKRPYKNAFSHDEAIRIIKDERGKHFDPYIIDVFMDIQDELKG